MATPTVEQLAAAMGQMMAAVAAASEVARVAVETAGPNGAVRAPELRRPDTRHLEKPKPFVCQDLDTEQKEWPEYRFQLVNFLVGLDTGFAEEL